MKGIYIACFIGMACTGVGQTPPIKPQTPDVKVPPPVVLPGPPSPERGAEALTVEEAVAIALQRQPIVAIAQADVRAARGRSDQARSAFYPQIGVNGSFSENEQFRGTSGGGTSPSRFSTGLSIDQLLFDFGRTRDLVRQQSALEKATRHGLTATQNDVALAVRQAFHDYAEAVKVVEVSENNVANRERQLALAEARLDTGLGAPSDFVRAKAGLADAVLSLITARNSATSSRVELARQMGIDPRTPINAAPSPQPASTEQDDVNALVETAMGRRPEIMEARERANAARFAVSAATKSNVPRIDLTAGISTRGADDPLETQNGTVGVSVSWTFADGGLGAGRTREARALEDAARARLVDVTQQVVSEIGTAYIDLRSAEQRVETAQAQVANARELLRISEGRYQGEIGQFLEVTDASATLFSAERNLAQAINDVLRAKARLDRAVGM